MADEREYVVKISAEASNVDVTMDRMKRAFESATKAIANLGSTLSAEFQGTQNLFSGIAANIDEMQKHLVSSSVQMEDYGARLRESLNGLDAGTPRARVNEYISLAKTVDKLNAAYEKQSDRIIDIKISLQEAEKQLSALSGKQSAILEATKKDLTITESRLEEYKARAQDALAAGFNMPPGLDRMISTMENRAAKLRDAISGDHMGLPGYAEYASQIAEIERTVARLQGDLERESAAMAATDNQASLYSGRIEALTSAQDAASNKSRSLSETLAAVGSRMASAAAVGARLASTLANIGRVGLHNLISSAGKVTAIFRAWLKPVAMAGDAIGVLTGRVKRFFGMMVSRLRRLAITAIFRDISKSSGEIAQISSSYNRAVSGMITSSKALGAQLVAIVEPIISVLGPAISSITDKLTAGADRLAQFTARLAGRDTYIRASKGVYNYADAVKESEDNTKKATKANKQFKASVMDFDELHKLEDNSRDTDDASAITGVTDAQLAKAKTQATALNEVADAIRAAMKDGDFWRVGEIIAAEVVKAFEWLQNVAGWSKNAQRFTEFLTNLTTAVNGFFGGLNAGKIGVAIGDTVNTAVNAFDQLLHGINADVIGAKIGALISALAQTVDWETMGRNLVAGFQFIVNMIDGFLQSDALEQMGAAVAKFFAGVASEFNPEHVGEVIANAVNGIAGFLANAFNPETFAEMGAKLATSINTIFENLNADQIAGGLNAFVQSIAAFIDNALSGLDWSTIVSKIAEIASKLDWGAAFKVIAVAALPALIPAVVGLAGKGLVILGTTLVSGLPALVGTVISGISALAGAGIPLLIGGLVAAAVAALVLNWDKVKEWGKTAIAWAKDTGEKIADGIGNALDWVGEKMASVKDWFGEKVESIKDFGKSVGNWFGDKVSGIKAFFFGEEQVSMPEETLVQGTSMLTETSLACMDASEFLSALTGIINNTMSNATNAILSALGQSGDIVLYVDSERLARATVRGLNMADIRENSASMAFV